MSLSASDLLGMNLISPETIEDIRKSYGKLFSLLIENLDTMPKGVARTLGKLAVAKDAAKGCEDEGEATQFIAETTRDLNVLLKQWLANFQRDFKENFGPIDEVTAFALDSSKTIEVARKVKGVESDKHAAELDNELRKTLGELIKEIESPEPSCTEPSFKEGILRWDCILADCLAGLSDKGKSLAKTLRTNASKRKEQWDIDHKKQGLWKVWVPEGYAFLLAQALWPSVKERIEQAERKPPALVALVHDEYLHLVTRNFKREGEDGQQAIIFPDESILQVTAIGEDTLNALMVQKGIDLFGSVASHKVFRWQIFSAHKQALEGAPDPRLLRIDGGWDYFAEILGLNGRQVKQLEQIVEAQHATSLMLPGHDKPSRLLIREYFKQRGRNRAQIKLILGTALLPDYVEELKKLAKGRAELQWWKRLIPICDSPPHIGRPNEAGAQSTLSMLTVGDFREHAVELVEDGGTDLMSRIEALAVKAGVPVRNIPALIDRWENDGTDGPAFLKRVDGKLHTLGDAHKAQRDFIEDGGRRELEGSKAGKRGAGKRREQLRRKGK